MAPPSEKRTASSKSHGSWLVNVTDDVVVPMTTLEVVDGLRKGRLTEQSLVWRIGMHDWSTVHAVPQLRLAAGFTPVPSVAAPLELEPTQKMPSSLAPTTAEAEALDPARAAAWDNLDELLANERRADQRSSRRVVLGAALGSAALAAVFTVYLLRAPPQHAAQGAEPARAADHESDAPALAPTLEAIASAPSASAPTLASAAPSVSAKTAATHFDQRPKRASPNTASSTDTTNSTDPTSAAPNVVVVPMAPLEPAPAASVSPETAPPASAPAAPAQP